MVPCEKCFALSRRAWRRDPSGCLLCRSKGSTAMSRDFWLSCGHHLLDRDSRGHLLVTDDFLKAYFARPELMPPEDACAAELELRNALWQSPRKQVPPSETLSIKDNDARENWQLIVAWRDHLLRHTTLEEAYVDIARNNI